MPPVASERRLQKRRFVGGHSSSRRNCASTGRAHSTLVRGFTGVICRSANPGSFRICSPTERLRVAPCRRYQPPSLRRHSCDKRGAGIPKLSRPIASYPAVGLSSPSRVSVGGAVRGRVGSCGVARGLTSVHDPRVGSGARDKLLMGKAPGETGIEHATPDPTTVRVHASLNQPVVPRVWAASRSPTQANRRSNASSLSWLLATHLEVNYWCSHRCLLCRDLACVRR